MNTLSNETLARFNKLAASKHAKLTAPEMIALCVQDGVNPEAYAAHLELQVDLIDAFERFHVSMKDDPAVVLLPKATLAAAYALSWLADKMPFDDFDEARRLGLTLVEVFRANASLCVIPPKPVALPTTDVGSNTLN